MWRQRTGHCPGSLIQLHKEAPGGGDHSPVHALQGPLMEQSKCTRASLRNGASSSPARSSKFLRQSSALCPPLRRHRREAGFKTRPPGNPSHFSLSLFFSLPPSPSRLLPIALAFRRLPHHNDGPHGEMFVSPALPRRGVCDRFGGD